MTSKEEISWVRGISLVQNKLILKSMLLVILVPVGLIAVLLLIISLIQQTSSMFWKMLPAFGLVFLVLIVLFFISTWLVLGNRFNCKFTLDEKGIWLEGIDDRAKTASRMAALLGIFGGKPTLAGSGILASSKTSQFIAWKDVKEIKIDQSKRIIHIKKGYLNQIDLYCLPENYQDVMDQVKARTQDAIST